MKTRPAKLGNKWKPMILGTGFLSSLWVIAGFVSELAWQQVFLLFVAQSCLSMLALLVFFKTLNGAQSLTGPSLVPVVAIHVMVYYGFSNLVPALLPAFKADTMSAFGNRIPASSAEAYVWATIAAILLLLGLTVGSFFAKRLVPMSGRTASAVSRSDLLPWLPNFGNSTAVCVVLVVLVAVGTGLYGLQFGSLLTAEAVNNLSTTQQLFFHGLFGFLPIAPLLGANAYLQAKTPRQKQLGFCLLIIASVAIFAALAVWRMRSTAMLAIVLPMGLLAYAGAINWRRVALMGGGLVVVVYVAVTAVRISNLETLVTATQGSVQASDLVAALGSRSGEQTIVGRAIFDASYRTAGLEGTAALIQAQDQGLLELKWGKVMGSGFLQALPTSLRPGVEIPERIKTAPSYNGVFKPGDWVTTILAEFVMDFGPILLFFPAILVGLCLSTIDRLLVRIGRYPLFEGVLVLRIAFLLYLVSAGASVADMSLLFFKATIGYTGLLLLIGLVTNGRRWRRIRLKANVHRRTSMKLA